MLKLLAACAVAGVLFANAADAAGAPTAPLAAPVVAVVPAGPVYAIRIDAGAMGWTTGGVEPDTAVAFDVRLPSDWGITLRLRTRPFFSPDQATSILTDILGRVYRAIGNGTIGVFATTHLYWTIGADRDREGGVGVDADYKTDNVDIGFQVGAGFDQGTYEFFRATFRAKAAIGEHVRIENLSVFSKHVAFAAFANFTTKVGYRIGPVTPFVRTFVGLDSDGLVLLPHFGIDFEQQVGGGPLTLKGSAELFLLEWRFNGFEATAGFEYAVGNSALTWRGHTTYFSEGVWELGIGVGLEFGDGRISGFGTRDDEGI